MHKAIAGIVVAGVVLLSSPQARADGFLSPSAAYLDARAHVFFDADFRDQAGLPVGGDADIHLDLAHQLDLTGTVGFLWGVGGDFDNFHIPLLVGVVYHLGQGSKGPFVGGSFGGMVTHFDSDTDWNSALDFYAGYRMGAVRLKVGSMFFDITELGNTASGYVAFGFDLM